MGARCGLVAIGLWTMVQSIFYGAMAVAAALAHRCVLPMDNGQVEYLIYTWHLRDSACGATINWDLLSGSPVPAEQRPTMPAVTSVAWRTDIIAIVYFAICCIWLLASFGLLMSVSRCCTPKRTLVYSWVTATALMCALDVAASGVFLADVINSLTEDAFLRQFEITAPQSFEFMPKYLLVVPSAIMLAIATRGIAFWILNVVLLFLAIAMARRSIFKDLSITGVDDEEDNTTHYMRNNNNLNKHIPVASPITNHNRYDDPALRSTLDHHEMLSDSPQLTERRYFEPLKGGDQSVPPYSSVTVDLQQQQQQQWHAPSPNKIPALQDTLLAQQRITIDRPHLRATTQMSPVSAAASTNNRYSASFTASPAETAQAVPIPAADYAQATSTASAPPPDELRSQLPWSYFKSRNDITGPKRTFTHLREDEDLPPVPVPDYTLHFPRTVRPSTNSSEEGAWTGPEQRY